MQAMSIIVGGLARQESLQHTRRLQGSRAIPDGHAKDPRSVLVVVRGVMHEGCRTSTMSILQCFA